MPLFFLHFSFCLGPCASQQVPLSSGYAQNISSSLESGIRSQHLILSQVEPGQFTSGSTFLRMY
uniref:Uncharacterized protein n=1 Tax=Tetraselmis sp. GSL018 TaxID=582737 RepID=A0A061RIL8_9CHLO